MSRRSTAARRVKPLLSACSSFPPFVCFSFCLSDCLCDCDFHPLPPERSSSGLPDSPSETGSLDRSFSRLYPEANSYGGVWGDSLIRRDVSITPVNGSFVWVFSLAIVRGGRQ